MRHSLKSSFKYTIKSSYKTLTLNLIISVILVVKLSLNNTEKYVNNDTAHREYDAKIGNLLLQRKKNFSSKI